MSNQTIDGVPRKWLEEYEVLADLTSGDAQKLRGLLDAPAPIGQAKPVQEDLKRAWQAGYDTGYYAKSPAHERPAAQPQGEPVACMPVERCYDVRAKMIIAFNHARQNGGDLDDAFDAAYKSALRFSPYPA